LTFWQNFTIMHMRWWFSNESGRKTGNRLSSEGAAGRTATVNLRWDSPFYWSNDRSSGGVDFVFQVDSKVISLEVKAAKNLQAKSLRFFA